MSDSTTASGSADWDFTTVAHLWDYRTGAIMAGTGKLDALSDADRQGSLTALIDRVLALIRGMDDGWLVGTSFFMVDDVYKSLFRDFVWSPGAYAYLGATAGVVVQELGRRGMVLHYVVDATEGEADLEAMLTYLPPAFQAAGLIPIGPQIVALALLRRSEEPPYTDITAIRRHRDEGHQIADTLIARVHQERRSSVYLNLDLDDGSPPLDLDVALSQRGAPGTIVVFRSEAPVEGSLAECTPPPGVALPKGP